MKLYLDDVRTPPEEWTLVSNVKDMMFLTATEKPTHISLDHDLGDTDPDHTGYDFMCWLEEAVFSGEYTKDDFPIIIFHTDNPVGRENMRKSLESINRMLGQLMTIKEKKALLEKLETANKTCFDCGHKYGVYSVGCSSVYVSKCGVCGETKPITETRDFGFFSSTIRKLKKEINETRNP